MKQLLSEIYNGSFQLILSLVYLVLVSNLTFLFSFDRQTERFNYELVRVLLVTCLFVSVEALRLF